MSYPYDAALLAALHSAHTNALMVQNIVIPRSQTQSSLPMLAPIAYPFGTTPAPVPVFGLPHPRTPMIVPVQQAAEVITPPPPFHRFSHSEELAKEFSMLTSIRNAIAHPAPSTKAPQSTATIPNASSSRSSSISSSSTRIRVRLPMRIKPIPKDASLIAKIDKYLQSDMKSSACSSDLEADIDEYLASSENEEEEVREATESFPPIHSDFEGSTRAGGSSGYESGSEFGTDSSDGTEYESDFGRDYTIYIREMNNLLSHGSIDDFLKPGSVYIWKKSLVEKLPLSE